MLILLDLALEFNKNLNKSKMRNIDNLMSFLKNEDEYIEMVLTIHVSDAKN